jgi:hypothetical protein
MRTRVLTCHAQGIPLGDKRCTSGHLPLGRAAKADWACCRVLERMFMYERRIELSMTRMLREFKKQQLMRRIEQQDVSYDQAVGGTEALTGKKVNLKKQSQFVPGVKNISPFSLNDYGDFSAAGDAENKANKACPERSRMGQFQTDKRLNEPAGGEFGPALRARQ